MRLYILLFCIWALQANAQIASKPSANYTTEKTDVKTSDSYFTEVKTYNDFFQLARIYNRGTQHGMPHILFTIDRNKDNRIYYIPLYEFHMMIK